MARSNETSLDRLPEQLANWARESGWTALRPIQIKCWDWFAESGSSGHDLIVCAPTATGKTEAVFLPLVAAVDPFKTDGFEVLYICPLKALIDQQAARLKSLLAVRELTVTAWHGEARQGREAARRRAEGVLIITPESLERLIREPEAFRMFARLKAAVIDELHAFFGTPRGVQIISQLARIDAMVGRNVRRIGLSATLSPDVEADARAVLRPAKPERVAVVSDSTAITEIEFALETFIDAEPPEDRTARDEILEALRQTVAEAQADEGRPTKALIFCNSRAQVEWCASQLRGEDDDDRAIVFPHHGSLKKAPRQLAETALRSPDKSTFVVCTQTLELGLDVGEIEQVIQLDPGPSVSSLRQRLGRSGRRAGKLSHLRMMVREVRADADSHPLTRLHLALFQSLAQLVLVRSGRFERPNSTALHLSTFVQQSLSMAAGEVAKDELEAVLLDQGPFRAEDREIYRRVLARLSRGPDLDLPDVKPLLVLAEQDRPSVYELAPAGRTLVDGKQFGAAFSGGRQYTVRAGNEILGELPAGHNLKAGDPVFFAGRRWAVVQVIEEPAGIFLRPAPGGRAPRFAGLPVAPSDLVVAAMRDLYSGREAIPRCTLNDLAKEQIRNAKKAFRDLGIDGSPVLEFEDHVLLFPWVASRGQATLVALLRHAGLMAAPSNVAVMIPDVGRQKVIEVLESIAAGNVPMVGDLARAVKRPLVDKHDRHLSPNLQRANYVSARLNMKAAVEAAARLIAKAPPAPSSVAPAQPAAPERRPNARRRSP